MALVGVELETLVFEPDAIFFYLHETGKKIWLN